MTETVEGEVGLVEELDRLDAELDRLLERVSGSAANLDDPGLVQALQRFERFRNRLSLVDHGLLGEVEQRELPERLLSATPTRFLTTTLRISAAEAQRRLHAAAALRPGLSPTGTPLPPRRPHLAAAQQAGEVTPEQVALIERALRPLDRPGYDPADVEAGERLLTGYAATFAPRELHRLAVQVADAIDPDGSLPDDELNADRRHVSLQARRDGSYVGELRLTGALGAKLRAVLAPLARPQTETGSPDGNAAAATDIRNHGQRMHDALEDVCDRVLRSGTLPDSGGTPATVIVTIDQVDLRQRTGHGTTADGAVVSVAEVLRIAQEADVLPVLRTATGAVLTLGRSRRIASPAQTCALIARDGGCSFPGCDRPPQWCERHHIRAWVDGGPTDLDNLTLLCRYHHHNFAARGWFCRMNADRLPEWLPPRWVDPGQVPRTHHRILVVAAAARARQHPALC